MPLLNYGLLTGKLTGHGPQPGGNPHYLLIIQAGVIEYRVAVNAQLSVDGADNVDPIQYQVLDLTKSKMAKAIKNKKDFLVAHLNPDCPRLDYIRDGFLDMSRFKNLKPGTITTKLCFMWLAILAPRSPTSWQMKSV